MLHACPKCGHPGLAEPRCLMCDWKPEPPAETHLLVGDQVVTIRWRLLDDIPVGDPVDTRSFWEWMQRRRAR